MSKEAIIDKIISDAQIKADAFVSEQQEKADSILADAAEQCKKYIAESQAETARLVDDLLARSKTVAELDAKKLILAKKTEMLERVFSRALEKLVQLDDKAMKKLLTDMLKEAEDGDVVTLNARGKQLLTADAIAKCAKQKKISLTLSDETGDFAGGMILSGGGVDKNLTFEVEIALLKEQLEAEMAKEIFG